RLAAQIVLQPRDELLVIALAHGLPAQPFVNFRHGIAGVAPVLGRELLVEWIVPGKMVGGEVREEKDRTAPVLARNHACSHVVVERIGLEHAAAHVLAVDEMLYAGAGVERARRQKIAEYGIIGEGPIAAMGERARQAAHDPPGSDAAHKKLEAA